MTQGYRAWSTAQSSLDAAERKQDQVWDTLMRRTHKTTWSGDDKDKWNLHDSLKNVGEGVVDDWFMQQGIGSNSHPISAIADNIQKLYEADLGYEVPREEAFRLAREIKDPEYRKAYGDDWTPFLKIRGQDYSSNELTELLGFINGHSSTVTSSMSGWEAAGNIAMKGVQAYGAYRAAKAGAGN